MTALNEKSEIKFLMKPTKSVYVFAYSIISFFGLALWGEIKEHTVWELFFSMLMLVIFVYYIVQSNSIELRNGKCIISKFLSKNITFSIGDVVSIKDGYAPQRGQNTFQRLFTVSIRQPSNNKIKRINFNPKLFYLEDIETLTHYLRK